MTKISMEAKSNNNLRDKFSIHLKENSLSRNLKGPIAIKSANSWIEEAKLRPIPNMIFSEFWYENELCILFADTNLGKSILAVQIAESISSGINIPNFKLETGPKRTLYLDFELSDKQFEKRYSNNYKDHYRFHSNLLRGELNPEMEIPKKFKSLEDYICSYIEKLITDHGIEVVIIDNLTYLKNDSEKAKDALDLMKGLKSITKSNQVSILVLAHTPKRDESKPISKNDLAGSKMLMNFCDSAFAIGLSTIDPNYRYLKQIKQRNTEHLYHSGNIIVCDIFMDVNFLKFRFLEYGDEKSHLKSFENNDMKLRDELMISLINEGKTNVEIGKILGLCEGAVRKRRKKHNI